MKQIIITILFSCLVWGCKDDIGVAVPEPDCVCSNLKDLGISKPYYGPQEGMIIFRLPHYFSIMPKTNFLEGRIPYTICTDSFLLKQVSLKGIKDSDQVIIKGVRSFPDGTCRGREYIKSYNGFDLPPAMIRITDIDKK